MTKLLNLDSCFFLHKMKAWTFLFRNFLGASLAPLGKIRKLDFKLDIYLEKVTLTSGLVTHLNEKETTPNHQVKLITIFQM